ncbi:MAG: glycosyltransferase [Methanoregula sp.]|nr:glycosyltransferase [Methanoregula sp.]
MKNLLVISWAMPPLLLPQSIQVARMLKSLAEYGWEITVICVDPQSIKMSQYDPFLEKQYAKYYTTVPVPSNEEFLLYRIFWYIFPNFQQSPDEKQVWIPRVMDVIQELLVKKDFSAIISFAQPWSDHLIGLKAYQMSGLPWIAHFSDPWVDSPYYNFNQKQMTKVKKMEESVIREADAIIFTSSQTVRLVMSKYPPDWGEKTFVIPHGYDSDTDFEVRHDIEQIAKSRLKLLHIGSFYPNMRTPEGLLRGLHLLDENQRNQIEVSLIGPHAERYSSLVKQLKLDDTVILHGPVSYEMSARLTAEADVLLVIDAPSDDESVFLPSKIVDYLAFRKPILGLTPLKGAVAELLERLECPFVSPTDSKSIACAIADLFQKWKNGNLYVSENFEKIACEYDIRQTTKMMDKILSDLVEKRSK